MSGRPTGTGGVRVLDLGPAAGEVGRLLAGTREDHLDAPTPCAGTPVRALLGHLAGVCAPLTRAARGSTGCAAGADLLDPGWRAALPAGLTGLVRAWRPRAAWEGVVEVGSAPVPSEVLGAVVLGELVLHGWDLARATGQPFRYDPASTRAVLALVTAAAASGAAPGARGLLGPVVPLVAVAPSASVLDRALALAGRDPAWAPPLPAVPGV